MIEPQNILELQQLTLQHMSNDKTMFRKELIKSIKWLQSYEILKLRKWLKANYKDTHGEIISEVFNFMA